MKKKVLIIRFSSIGDIIQCMSVVDPLHHQLDADVHWICRSDFSTMLATHPNISKLWSYNKRSGLKGLFAMAKELRKENFDYVYDAHQNVRSFIVRFFLGLPQINPRYEFTVRRKTRFRRFLFFQFKIKKALPMPFKAVKSFQKPLKKWGIYYKAEYPTAWRFSEEVEQKGKALLCTIFDERKVITLVPSAAWELKRWPVENWKELVRLMPDFSFVVLAGPADDFTEEIKSVAPERVFNLAGKTNLQESFYVISQSQFVVSADTGFLHAADLFKRKAIALMGPTAFGHPTGNTVRVLENNELKCRPCTKAGNTTCKLPNEYRACLLEITPQMVVDNIKELYITKPN